MEAFALMIVAQIVYYVIIYLHSMPMAIMAINLCIVPIGPLSFGLGREHLHCVCCLVLI